MADKKVLLRVENLKKHFILKRDFFGGNVKKVHAVDGINFHIFQGETFGLVGESGCGKSTTGRTIINLYKNTAGAVYFEEELISLGYEDIKDEIASVTRDIRARIKETTDKNQQDDLRKEMNEKLTDLRMRLKDAKSIAKAATHDPRDIQMIFQDPYASLNPRMTVAEIIAEGIKTHNLLQGDAIAERVYTLLETVGLKREHASRYPHEFSGGQRQRIGIARALAVDPKLIICDEPISALDVSIQAQVVNMLEDLQTKLGLTYLFIAHDLSMVKYISSRIGVMYLGKLMEVAESDPLYDQPLHPYTKSLLSSIPLPDPEANRNSDRIILEGDVPSPINPKPGCRFASRCVYAKEECFKTDPVIEEVLPGRYVACLRVKEINKL